MNYKWMFPFAGMVSSMTMLISIENLVFPVFLGFLLLFAIAGIAYSCLFFSMAVNDATPGDRAFAGYLFAGVAPVSIFLTWLFVCLIVGTFSHIPALILACFFLVMVGLFFVTIKERDRSKVETDRNRTYDWF